MLQMHKDVVICFIRGYIRMHSLSHVFCYITERSYP